MVRLALERQSCVRNSMNKLDTPAAIAHYVGRMWGCRPQEYVIGLYFNAQTQLIAVHEVAMGGISSSPVDPKVLFSAALAAGAVALVLVHNHPSGEVQPSKEDLELTQKIADGCKVLTIMFMDHLIVGKGGAYYSFRSHGQL